MYSIYVCTLYVYVWGWKILLFILHCCIAIAHTTTCEKLKDRQSDMRRRRRRVKVQHHAHSFHKSGRLFVINCVKCNGISAATRIWNTFYKDILEILLIYCFLNTYCFPVRVWTIFQSPIDMFSPWNLIYVDLVSLALIRRLSSHFSTIDK